MTAEFLIAVLAFGIAWGTLAYNVHEIKIISKNIREGFEVLRKGHEELRRGQEELHKGLERMVRVLERMEKRLSSRG